MDVSRRLFIRNGVATVTLGLAAPSFLSAIAQAQGLPSRHLVVVYLGGGNDALNTLIPYQDAAYYSRRPTIAVPAGQVLQVGTDAAGQALGLHPRLGGLLNIFNEGRLALVQRSGYPNSSRSHFEATDILGHRQPAVVDRLGLARTLSRHAASTAGRARRVEHHGRDAACAHLRAKRCTGDSRTRPPTRMRARTAVRPRSKSARPRRRWRPTRRPAGRIWRS